MFLLMLLKARSERSEGYFGFQFVLEVLEPLKIIAEGSDFSYLFELHTDLVLIQFSLLLGL